MRFETATPPHLAPRDSVRTMMVKVLVALVPAAAAWTWFFGWGLLVNLMVAVPVAFVAEAAMLKARSRPLRPAVTDGSAVVTAVLLAFALPPLLPWWITAVGVAFAIVFAKHLYGGLGYNPFNPAMAGYVVLLVSFPTEMTRWLPPAGLADWQPGFIDTLHFALTGNGIDFDAVTAATPLDAVRTGLTLGLAVPEVRANPLFGAFAGHGWEWLSFWVLAGGAWLLYERVIHWRIPAAVLGTVAVLATVFWLIDPDAHAPAGFHLFAGATMLCAFFIATDPVSAATTPRGRIVYGIGIGALIYVIRAWGGYPDAVAFAVLLMNMAVPAIDHFTRGGSYAGE